MSERVLQGHHLDTNFKSKELLRFPNDLYTQLKKDFSRNQVNLMRQAYTFASNAHDGQERMDGKPYISHPLEVARILVEMNMDVDSICAGLMHDVLEDCNIEKRNIDKIFGKDVSEIVDGVSKIGKLDFQSKAERDINSFQKMALAMAKDVRVIVVKLADRLHNMRTIDFLPRNKQIRVAKETLEIYGPIALRIGMQKVRAELEDLAFDCLHPLRAEMLRSAIKKSSGGRKKIVYKIRKEIKRDEESTGERSCNCRNPNECPLNGNCLTKEVFYEATVTSDLPRYGKKIYDGITERPFKDRFKEHKKSFNNRKLINDTELSKEIWRIKERGGTPTVKWKILRNAKAHNPRSKRCMLCTTEKLAIAEYKGREMLNKRTEAVAKCRHQLKYALASMDVNI